MNNRFQSKLSYTTLFFVAVIYLWVSFNSSKFSKNLIIRSDTYGYSMYLSAIVVYHDIKTLTFFDRLDSVYRPCGNYIGDARHKCANGNKVFKYTCGNALMMSPFYLPAHFFTKYFSSYPADGYSHWYQFSIIISTVFWVVLGFFFVIRVLSKWVDAITISISVLCVAFGTNLFNYSTFDFGFTHTATFFWFAFLLYQLFKWLETKNIKNALFLGLSLGFVGLVRPPDLTIVVLPAILFLSTFIAIDNTLRVRLLLQGLGSATILVLVFSIQLFYWKYVTGEWIHDSYVGEHFDFWHPHIIDGLLSYKKGWLLYTPMMIFAVAGLYYVFKKNRVFAASILAFLLLNLWVVFSWTQWSYGGSFGARSLIQSYAVLIIPFAFFVQQMRSKKASIQSTIVVIFVCFITLNLFQTLQYKRGTLHWDNMTKEAYWGIFGRLKISREEYLHYYYPKNG